MQPCRNAGRGRLCRWAAGAALGWLVVLGAPGAGAGTFTVYGPDDFIRSTGKPVDVVRSFPAPVPGAGYTLHIDNGGARQQFGRSASAVVQLNGVTVAGPSDFNATVRTIDKPVTLTAQNRLEVELRGSPGSGVTVTVVGQVLNPPDTTPPTVAITAPAEGSFLATATPTVTATYTDAGSGVDPASVRLAVDGVDVTAQAQVTASGLTFTPAAPLAEGGHSATLTVNDRAGNLAQATRSFVTDSVPPQVSILSPAPGRTVGETPPSISVQYSDFGSGLDPGGFELTLDGQPFACAAGPDGATCPVPSLASGSHIVIARVRDRAGNPASGGIGFEFIRDLAPPSITITSPAPGGLTNALSTLVSGTVTDDSGIITSVRVNGQTAALSEGGFSAYVPLAEGENTLTVVATDVAGRAAQATATIILDSQAPSLTVTSPATGQSVGSASVRVTGQADDGSGSGLARVEVGGAQAAVTQGAFSSEVPLVEGSNSIAVRAFDNAGNVRQTTVEVQRFTVPAISITSPADLSFLAATTIDVQGTVSEPGTAVAVNGQPAAVTGTSFVAHDVPLIEGGNILTATVTTPGGRIGSATINVVRDLTPPHLSVDRPLDGSVVLEPTVTVSGLVNDIVAGTVNAQDATVEVNGRTAAVANRSFVATGVPLSPGDNVLTVEAQDASGNRSQTTLHVRRETPVSPRVAVVSGNNQSSVIGTPLPEPLVVSLLDAAGLPVPGKVVFFKVMGSDGALNGGHRQVIVVSDSGGRAQVSFTVGNHAGAGDQEVQAIAAGFQGPAVFTATALTGNPSLIVVDAGDQQLGVAGQQLPRPLVAAVTDPGFNRLPGIAVRLRVVQGDGRFPNGLPELTIPTDSDGRAITPFVLDPAEGTGNNVVEATIAGLDGGPAAIFTATGLAAGDPAATSISGVVLDSSNDPVPGVTLRILDSPLTAQADAKGVFHMAGVPVGTLKLIVDGSTTTRPGSWPDLEYVVTTVPGRDNTLGMPIYLLPLDLAHGLTVDETHGGTLTLPDFPGFALTVLPGSVTFPNGSRSGVVSVTVVHADRVPMVPNFGQQPRLIVTIQPAGARFDPPARLTLPNVEGFAPGHVAELYSFDHDLGHFVSIGPATVSEDGTTIVSNPGVGVVKAGWHCCGDPVIPFAAHDCLACRSCANGSCQPNDSLTCDDHDECTINDRCKGGSCKGDPVQVQAINGACVGATGQPVTLTAASNAPDKVKWQAPSGNPAMGMGGSFAVTYATEGDFVVTALCGPNSKTKQVSTGPDCASITAMLDEPEVPGNTGGNWGKVVPGVRKNASYKGCASSKWCFRLEKYTEAHSFAVNGSGAIDVTGANDPVVTPATCQAIIADFTPPPVGTAQGPPRAHYWSSAFTTAHERFHVTDVHNRITTKVFADLQAFVNDPSRCTDCKSPVPAATFDAEMNRLFQQYFAILNADAEMLAHNQSNAMYRALIAQIQQRARSAPAAESWPAACK